MVKYYCINIAFMVINTVLLVLIKFSKYNRSVLGVTGEVPKTYFFLLLAAIIGTGIAYIMEIVQLDRMHNITLMYVAVNLILVSIPFAAYILF